MRSAETTVQVEEELQERETTIRWLDENGAELNQVHVLDYKYNRKGHPIRKRPGKIEMCTKTQKIVLGISGAVISLIIVIMVIVLFTSPSTAAVPAGSPTVAPTPAPANAAPPPPFEIQFATTL